MSGSRESARPPIGAAPIGSGAVPAGPGAAPGLDARIEALVGELGGALRAAGVSLVTAESCTGGAMAAALTAVAGSSAWFERGFVAYSNEAKEQQLLVPKAVMVEFGAVSEPAVAAMARGALRRSEAGIALAASGISGPGGGTTEKPVGTVCLAWAGRDGPVCTETRHFPGDRRAVRAATVLAAFDGLAERLRSGVL